jgi:hypothetical protein
VRSLEDGDVPERHFSVAPEGVPCVRRYHDNVARFGDDVDAVNGVDASSFMDNEHLGAVVAMLRCADPVLVAADANDHIDAVLVTEKDPRGPARRCRRTTTQLRRLDQGVQRFDHEGTSQAEMSPNPHILPDPELFWER